MQRLGVIIPSSNTTVEQEFSKVLHNSTVSLHIARIPLSNVTVEGLIEMEKEVEGAATLLKDADIDVVAFACTSGSLIKGINHNVAIAEKIAQITKCATVITSSAIIDALNKLNTHKIALVTPYIEEINRREVEFLSKNGFDITSIQALEVKENLKIGRLTSDDAATLARKVNSKHVDAILISCTNFATFGAIPMLEAQLKKPVISSNSATLWASLNTLQTKSSIALGKLFEV